MRKVQSALSQKIGFVRIIISKQSHKKMKKALLFFGGFVSGIIATFLTLFLISFLIQANNNELYGLTLFPKKGECIKTNGEIEVFQVLKPNAGLARTGNIINGIVVLLVNYDGKHYYDDQKIKIPRGKCARHIGTYQYTSMDERERTVPVVAIE